MVNLNESSLIDEGQGSIEGEGIEINVTRTWLFGRQLKLTLSTRLHALNVPATIA